MAQIGASSPWYLLGAPLCGELLTRGFMTGLLNGRLEMLGPTKRVFAMGSNATVGPSGLWLLVSGVLALCGFGLGEVGMVGRAGALLFRGYIRGVHDMDWELIVKILLILRGFAGLESFSILEVLYMNILLLST